LKNNFIKLTLFLKKVKIRKETLKTQILDFFQISGFLKKTFKNLKPKKPTFASRDPNTAVGCARAAPQML